MDTEKESVKRRKKCSKRSRSSSSSSEDNNSGSSRRKRRLKESKLTKNDGKNLIRSLSDVEEGIRKGDELGRKIKGRKRRGKVKRKEESEDSSSRSSSESKQRRKKKRKEKKRKEKKKKKKIKKKEKEFKKQQEGSIVKIKAVNLGNEDDKEGQQEDILSGPKPMKSTEEPGRRAMVPMTKEEYEKQQSQVRRVFDPDTGRKRLVKGDGEIVEEAVSYERHKEINKLSTFGDGAAFQKSLGFNSCSSGEVPVAEVNSIASITDKVSFGGKQISITLGHSQTGYTCM